MGRSLEQQLKATKEQTDQLDSLSASHMSVKKDCKSLLDLQQGVYTTFQNSSEQQGALQDNIFAPHGPLPQRRLIAIDPLGSWVAIQNL